MFKRFVIAVLLLAPLAASALTVEELQLQIQALVRQIEALQGINQQANQQMIVQGGACPTLYRVIQYGSRGEDVASLQRYLISIKLLAADSATGYFGVQTERAVQSFQEVNGVVKGGLRHETGFGVVGPATMRAIAAVCKTGQYVHTTLLPQPTQSYYYDPYAGTCTWNGERIANGSTVRAYEQSSVPKGDTCKRETRTCVNGVFSGSYRYVSCSAEKGTESCTFKNLTIQHGATVLAYEAASVAAGSSCRSQIRTCDDGTLSGSYDHALCTGGGTTVSYSQGSYYSQGTYYSQGSYAPSGVACSLDGATVPHGKSRYFYRDAYNNPPPGGWTDGQCSTIGQVRTCNNGTLSGDAVFAKNTCGNLGSSLAAAPPYGYAPLTVTFTVPHTPNTGGIFPTISFGDGQSHAPTGDSSSPRYYVVHTYTAPGTYTVSTSGGFSYDPHETITVVVD